MSPRGRAGLAFLLLAAQGGCLIWPFPTGHLLQGRGRITRPYVEPLQVGVATREEVLLRLGEPDEVAENGQVLIYRWTEVRGFLALAGNSTAVAIPFPGHRALRLTFGPDARLLHLAFQQGPPSQGPAEQVSD